MDDGLDKFGTSGVIAFAVVNTSEVHEDDASGTSGMAIQIIEKSLVGMGGIVTIAVAE